MNILFLGYKKNVIIDFLSKNHSVFVNSDKITTDDLIGIDFVISYGYSHIIPEDCVKYMVGKMVNLHLGYNQRGSDPILWSIIDGTQPGITIHKTTNKINKGDIILNKKLSIKDGTTIVEVERAFRSEIEVLFIDNADKVFSYKGEGESLTGTFRNAADKDFYTDELDYRNMKIRELKDVIHLRRISSMERLASFYEPLFWLLDTICSKENVCHIDMTSPRTHVDSTMILYLAMGLGNDYFNKRVGVSRRLYSLNDIGSFFSKSHALVSVAKRKMDNWAEIYKEYRIKKQFYEIKIRERYGVIA